MSASDVVRHSGKPARGPRPGETAPGFTLPDTLGRTTRLFDFRQRQPVLLAFMHVADCPECRTWLKSLACRRARLDELGAGVLGIAPEPVEALGALAAQLDLPFRLLSDTAGAVAARYGLSPDHPTVAVFALDRYGSVLDVWRADDANALPPVEAPLDSIAFAEMEDCGCGLPAWPPELMATEDE